MFYILALIFVATFTDGTAGGDCSCSCSSGKSSEKSTAFLSKKYRSAMKQCTYNPINDARDVGEIRTCHFTKVSAKTAIRATFQGDLRMVGCSDKKCCRRWFLTFNGQECQSPAPIDAVVYADTTLNLHRPGTLDGLCENLPKGNVVVGLSVGACKDIFYPRGNARTGWNSVSRLIIEEVAPLQ